MRVVADEYRARAPVVANRPPYLAKYALQCVAFVDGRTQGMMRVDAVDGDRCLLDVGALERLDVITDGFATGHLAVAFDLDENSRYFQQGVGFAVETAGLDIDEVVETISKGAAGSWQMENRARTMAAGEFEFGFAVEWMRKDLKICLAEADRLEKRVGELRVAGRFEEALPLARRVLALVEDAELPLLERIYVIEPPEGPLPDGVFPAGDLLDQRLQKFLDMGIFEESGQE